MDRLSQPLASCSGRATLHAHRCARLGANQPLLQRGQCSGSSSGLLRAGLAPGARPGRPQFACSAGNSGSSAPTAEQPADVPQAAQVASCVVVVPADARSPLGKHEDVQWREVMAHVARRLANVNPGFQAHVFTDAQIQQDEAGFQAALQAADILLAAAVQDPATAAHLERSTAGARTALFFDCCPRLQQLTRLDGARADSVWLRVFGRLRFPRSVRIRKLLDSARLFWQRQTSDDLMYIFLVLIDGFVTEVDTVRALRAQSLDSILCMARNCRSQIFGCLSDPECRAALDCLQACAPNDQVCSYRCIASHEAPAFEAFSLCILQKHNCLGLSVPIPARPDPAPMAAFRGRALSHEAAEQLLIGWLGEKEWSWRVVGGQNAAYDQFPCQFQLFYRGKARNGLWYDPVFTVRTLAGARVWRRRHYRVRRAQLPGTFRLTVLDNGVTSNEFWRILDVPDDLSWALFFYSGAASVVGQSYTGAVLCTPDGKWPAEDQQERVRAALDRADIKTWELFRVDNGGCSGAPLDIPEKDSAANPIAGALTAAA